MTRPAEFITRRALDSIKLLTETEVPASSETVERLLLVDRPEWINYWGVETSSIGLPSVCADLFLKKRGEEPQAPACHFTPFLFAYLRLVNGLGHAAHIIDNGKGGHYVKNFRNMPEAAGLTCGRLAVDCDGAQDESADDANPTGGVAVFSGSNTLDHRPPNLSLGYASKKAKRGVYTTIGLALQNANDIPSDLCGGETWQERGNDYLKLLLLVRERHLEEWAYWEARCESEVNA